MERDDWIAVCAHQLQRQWRTVDPDQLDEVAADLWCDGRLRAMAPARAAIDWLRPLDSSVDDFGADQPHLKLVSCLGEVESQPGGAEVFDEP